MKYTINFSDNPKVKCFVVRYQNDGEKEWKTKWLPRRFAEHQRPEAESFFRDEMSQGSTKKKTIISDGAPHPRSIRHLFPIFLKRKSEKTLKMSPNYLKSLTSNVNRWLLNNEKHLDIEHLDLQKDFTFPLIKKWLESIPNKAGSVILIAGTLTSFIQEMMVARLIDSKMVNPMHDPEVIEYLRALRDQREKSKMQNGRKVKIVISEEQVKALIQNEKIMMMRRVIYLLAVTTGMRDNEIRGLTFQNVSLDSEIPFVNVQCQLLRPGCFPAKYYEELRVSKKDGGPGMTREEIDALPNAILSAPKSEERRYLPLHPEAVKALRWWREQGWKEAVGMLPNDESPVFPRVLSRTALHLRGTFAQSQSAHMIELDLKKVEQPSTYKGKKITFHALRRTFATNLKDAGVSSETVGELLGHGAGTSGTVANENYINFTERSLTHPAKHVALLEIPPLFPPISEVSQETAAE